MLCYNQKFVNSSLPLLQLLLVQKVGSTSHSPFLPCSWQVEWQIGFPLAIRRAMFPYRYTKYSDSRWLWVINKTFRRYGTICGTVYKGNVCPGEPTNFRNSSLYYVLRSRVASQYNTRIFKSFSPLEFSLTPSACALKHFFWKYVISTASFHVA